MLPKELIDEIILYLRESNAKSYLVVKQINRECHSLPEIYKIHCPDGLAPLEHGHATGERQYSFPVWWIFKYIESIFGRIEVDPLFTCIYKNMHRVEVSGFMMTFITSPPTNSVLNTIFDHNGYIIESYRTYFKFGINEVPKIIYRISQL